jgi:hypothetical protein
MYTAKLREHLTCERKTVAFKVEVRALGLTKLLIRKALQYVWSGLDEAQKN